MDADQIEIIDEQPEAPPLSISDHAKQFGPNAQRPDAVAESDPVDPLKPIRPVDQQRRDQGKFAEGKQRIKAKDAVDRINSLTARAKGAEERLAAAEAEVTRLRTQHAAPSTIARAEAKVDTAQAVVDNAQPAGGARFPEAEPDEADPKFGGDYAKYLRAVAGYEGRKAAWDDKQQQVAERQAATRQQQEQETIKGFGGRVEAARTKYGDFDAVAFAPTTIPPGSLVDQWIWEDESGADVLYYLQGHPQERDEILGLPVLQQAKRLSLLSQRFSSSPSRSAGATGSAARPQFVPPPRPPNPVRTEAQRASDGPPATDGTLSVVGHRRAFHRP